MTQAYSAAARGELQAARPLNASRPPSPFLPPLLHTHLGHAQLAQLHADPAGDDAKGAGEGGQVQLQVAQLRAVQLRPRGRQAPQRRAGQV